jgi:hypothetical protein
LWSIVCHFGHCIVFPSEIYKFCQHILVTLNFHGMI